MDALEFFKEGKRMCNFFVPSCDGCPLEDETCIIEDNLSDEVYKKNISTVEQWVKDHPRKTRQSVFLEQWPEASVDERGALRICPAVVSAPHRNGRGGCANLNYNCADCKKEFWMQEVE